MNERPTSRPVLIAVLGLIGVLALTIVLAWPEAEPPPPRAELPGPLETRLGDIPAHGRSALRRSDEPSDSRKEAAAAVLEVRLFDGFENLAPDDRPRYALIVHPRGAAEEAEEAQVVQVHSGLNRLEELAPGDWSCELAGLPIVRQGVALRRGATEKIVWDEHDLIGREFSPFRLIGVDIRGKAVNGLGLALQGPKGSIIDIAPIEGGCGELDLLIGPVWEGLVVTCRGWEPIPLREATYLAPTGAFIGHDPEPNRERVIRLRRGLCVLFR